MSSPKLYDLRGQGVPNVVADAIDALVWDSASFWGCTDLLSVAGGARGGGLLLNPAGSGASIFVYGLLLASSATTNARLGLVSSVPAGYVTTGTQIQPKHLQATGSGLVSPGAVLYQNTASAAMSSFGAVLILAGGQPWQAFSGYASSVLRPGTGLQVVIDGPSSAFTVGVSYFWVEFKAT